MCKINDAQHGPGNTSVHQKDQGRSSGATINEAMAEIIQNPTASTRMITKYGGVLQAARLGVFELA